MWIYLCVNIGIALLLFYVDGKIGLILSNHRDFFSYNPYLFGDNGKEKRSNYTLCVLSPAVSVAIFAVAYEHIGFDSGIDSLWMICPLYWGVRFVYFALRNRLAFLDLKYEGVRFVLSILITTAVFYVICVKTSRAYLFRGMRFVMRFGMHYSLILPSWFGICFRQNFADKMRKMPIEFVK